MRKSGNRIAYITLKRDKTVTIQKVDRTERTYKPSHSSIVRMHATVLALGLVPRVARNGNGIIVKVGKQW